MNCVEADGKDAGAGLDVKTGLGCSGFEVEEESPIDEKTQVNYKIWKKNTPFLYDFVTTHSLLWPSLTVELFPDVERPTTTKSAELGLGDSQGQVLKDLDLEHEVALYRVLVGTFTLGQGVDNLSILQLPCYTNLNKKIGVDNIEYVVEKQELELTKVSKKRIKVLQKINHLGDVNRARYCPQNPDVIVSANNLGDFVLYDRTKHANIKSSLTGDDTGIDKPQLRLCASGVPSSSEIFAFDWNRQKEGVIVSGDMAGRVNVYDIKSQFTSRDIHTINESKAYNNHDEGVNDIQWVSDHDQTFCLVDESGFIRLYDTRLPEANAIKLSHQQSDVGINSLSINPHNSFCLATGDSNGGINVWDIRSFGSQDVKPTLSLNSAHQGSITQLKWHNRYSSVLASSSSDKTVKFYDLSSPEHYQDAFFTHAGHMLGVNDFDWSDHEDWLTASVADDNSIQFWKPSHSIVGKFKTK